MTALTFLRWTRTGAVTAIPETEQQGRAQPRASFGVTVHLQASKPYAADTTVTLYGPSDVIGLDPRQILRRVPEPGTSQASTQVFAHVELDAPDLPWRFTPFAPTTQPDPAEAGPKRQGTLTPWLCLAVVERRDGVTFDYTRGDLLPVLTVDNAARELPDPAAAHAWAHVQLAGAPDTTDPAILGDWIQDHPERTLARLICPRLLDPDTPYLACLIPVYALGAAAGLGQTLTGDPTQDPAPSAYAWSPTATPARLPVYSSWEFVTGVTGSFEDLVRRLQRLDDLGDVGVRDLDVSAPGWGLPTAPGRDPAPLPGALRPVTLPPGWTGDPALVDQLADAVDQVAEVAPPIYGRWHAAVTAVPRDGAHPLWLGQLNLDPGLRVAAGLGAQVVQAEQETFVAAAWAQAGDVLAANRLLRQARAGIAVGRRLHRRHLAPLDPYAQLAVCGPALSRLRRSAGSTSTVHGALASGQRAAREVLAAL